MNNYSENDLKLIREAFDLVDKDKDEYISYNELENGIIALGGEGIKRTKKNKNCKYSFEDFVKICSENNINLNEIESKLNQAFQFLESDRRGYVNISSLEALLSNEKVLPKDISQILKEANCDENGLIDYSVFVKEIVTNNIVSIENTE